VVCYPIKKLQFRISEYLIIGEQHYRQDNNVTPDPFWKSGDFRIHIGRFAKLLGDSPKILPDPWMATQISRDFDPFWSKSPEIWISIVIGRLVLHMGDLPRLFGSVTLQNHQTRSHKFPGSDANKEFSFAYGNSEICVFYAIFFTLLTATKYAQSSPFNKIHKRVNAIYEIAYHTQFCSIHWKVRQAPATLVDTDFSTFNEKSE
jgi:hypothetical protein